MRTGPMADFLEELFLWLFVELIYQISLVGVGRLVLRLCGYRPHEFTLHGEIFAAMVGLAFWIGLGWIVFRLL